MKNLEFGFKNYDELIFGNNQTDLSPFSIIEWNLMINWYWAIAGIIGGPILIAIVILAWKMIVAGISPDKRTEVKDNLMRLFFGAVSITLAPLFVKFMLMLNNNLVSMLVAISVFKSSGVLDYVLSAIKYLFESLSLNTDFIPALPTAFLKPLSGSGARAMMIDAFQNYGVDSFVGFISSIIQGSTETTFYVLTVYFGAIKITKTGSALPCALIADFAGITSAIMLGYLFY